MRINDEILEKLGNVFVYFNFYEKHGITFEIYVKMYQAGTHMVLHT